MENDTKGWSIAVDGAQIFAMPAEERFAEIIEPAPSYRVDSEENTSKGKIKLIACVQLSDGRKADYYMNRTSARKIASILKTDLSEEGMKKWVGNVIVWGKILDMNVGGQEKKVLYVTEARPNHLRAAQNPQN